MSFIAVRFILNKTKTRYYDPVIPKAKLKAMNATYLRCKKTPNKSSKVSVPTPFVTKALTNK
jgi:hypothetical protein